MLKQNSLIESKKPLNLLLATYQKAETEAKAKKKDKFLFIKNFNMEKIERYYFILFLFQKTCIYFQKTIS